MQAGQVSPWGSGRARRGLWCSTGSWRASGEGEEIPASLSCRGMSLVTPCEHRGIPVTSLRRGRGSAGAHLRGRGQEPTAERGKSLRMRQLRWEMGLREGKEEEEGAWT